MDVILMKEEPLIRKCCYVIPLRLCLQTWAFIKLAGDLAAMGYIALVVLLILEFGGRVHNVSALILAMLGVALAVDISFLITLTVGIYKKSIKIIRVFYIYVWVAMAIEIVFIIFCLVQTVMGSEGIVVIVIGISYILLDLCIIITLKSEMVKLRNKNQFAFSRISRDGETTGKLCSED